MANENASPPRPRKDVHVAFSLHAARVCEPEQGTVRSLDAQPQRPSPSTNTDVGPADPYDPHNFGNLENATTFWGTVFHVYMISAGPALLCIPKNFVSVGYVLGFAITFPVFLVYWYTMRMMVRSEYQLCELKRQPRMTYSETLFHAFDQGPPNVRWFAPYGCHIVQILYIVTWIGSLNIVLIAENLQTVYGNVTGSDVSVHTAMLCAFVPLLLLTWVHKLKFLVPLSAIANGLTLFCILAVVYHVIADPSPLHMPSMFGSPSAIPNYLGSVLFNLNATGLLLPLKNEMRRPRKFDSTCGVLTVSYFPMALLYAVFGLLCSLKYGYSLKDTVILNLPADDRASQIIILLFTVALAFQYPLITYVVFDTIWNNVLKERRKSMAHQRFWEYAVRTAVFVVSYAAAFAVPNIRLFLSISGTVGTSIDSLIFPALVETLVAVRMGTDGTALKKYYFKNGFIIFLAIILLITGLTNCVKQIVEYYYD